MGLADRLLARHHLRHCAPCRGRRERLEGVRAERVFQRYRELQGAELPWEASEGERARGQFAEWLTLEHERTARAAKASSVGAKLAPLPLAVGVVCGLVLAVLVGATWKYFYAPSITANTLLVRAQQHDAPQTGLPPGVVRQTVRLRAGAWHMERSVFWDRQGRRRLRSASSPEGAPGGATPLRRSLLRAGVDWDQPISAASYQSWHDGQHERADRISRHTGHLLTLVTTVTEGPVLSESLTVREADFHPVGRTVEFRDHSTVEIAELSLEVLPWSAVDAGLFAPENLREPAATPVTDARAALPVLARALPPTEASLDRAELSARYILNQLGADTGEQIAITRGPAGVAVQGVVDTPERKRELTGRLAGVPGLRVELNTPAELPQAAADPASTAALPSGSSLPDQPSALQTFLLARGHTVGESNSVAEKLFAAALAAGRQCEAMAELEERFASLQNSHAPVDLEMLALLLARHREQLRDELREEQTLLEELGWTADERPSPKDQENLREAARTNLQLVRALTSTDSGAANTAAKLGAQILSVVQQLDQAVALAPHHPPQEP
jgi:hypothetical protein